MTKQDDLNEILLEALDLLYQFAALSKQHEELMTKLKGKLNEWQPKLE